MVKNVEINKTKSKKIIKLLLLSPLFLIGFVVVFVVGVYATAPFFDKLDQDRFVKLEAEMSNLYGQIKSVSDEGEDWKYAAVCSEQYSGDFPTGQYNCVTSISIQKTISSVDELNNLQAKYYPIINNSESLETKTELDLELPGDFGKNFVVSSAEKNYVEKKSNIDCNYIIKLNQAIDEYDLDYDSYGSEIIGGTGKIAVSLRCEDIAREKWYQLVDDTDMLIPEVYVSK